jgi:hypothetical protein
MRGLWRPVDVLLAAAVALAARGWHVFPCERKGKRPLVACVICMTRNWPTPSRGAMLMLAYAFLLVEVRLAVHAVGRVALSELSSSIYLTRARRFRLREAGPHHPGSPLLENNKVLMRVEATLDVVANIEELRPVPLNVGPRVVRDLVKVR